MTLCCYEGVDVLLIPDDPGRPYAFFTFHVKAALSLTPFTSTNSKIWHSQLSYDTLPKKYVNHVISSPSNSDIHTWESHPEKERKKEVCSLTSDHPNPIMTPLLKPKIILGCSVFIQTGTNPSYTKG